MTIKKMYKIEGDQLIINLPENLKSSGKKVLVIIEDYDSLTEKKIKLVKKAASDPLFLEDVSEITKDFEFSDLE
jgi:hypothetical protein